VLLRPNERVELAQARFAARRKNDASSWINMIPADVTGDERRSRARRPLRGSEGQTYSASKTSTPLHSMKRADTAEASFRGSHSAKQTAFYALRSGDWRLAWLLSESISVDTENELALLASGLVGCGLGFLVGSWLFSMNFVEDESLEGATIRK